MIENLEARQFLSATYFVSPSGSDNGIGSSSDPFATIQRAANVAVGGDHVEIEGGLYRETVTPRHSGSSGNPVVYEAYAGQKVVVSGTEPINGWSHVSGDIYSASMPWTLGEGNDEIFVDGKALVEARYPNTSISNISHPATETIQSVSAGGSSATIYDSNLNQSTNYWKGAEIHIAPGQGWVDQIGYVTSSSPGKITISYQYPGGGMAPWSLPSVGNKFYLVGKYQMLDAPGEWYRDPSSGLLYVWMPNSDNPSNHDVEAKARQDAFNFTHVSNIVLQGVTVFGATIATGYGRGNIVINDITAEYISQSFTLPNGWFDNTSNSIFLAGSGDVLENSTIAYSWGDGVVAAASGILIQNNVIHDVDLIGADAAGIRVDASGVTVSHNTVYNCGRSGIKAGVGHVTIINNLVHDVGLQTTEPGGIYTVGTSGGTIAYNTVYNIHTGGFGGTGIFLDNNTSDWDVHNNITYNVDYGMKLNFTCNGDVVSNNTLGATILSINTNQLGNWGGTRIYDNVFTRGIVTTPGASITNNVFTGSSADPGNTSAGAGNISSGASFSASV